MKLITKAQRRAWNRKQRKAGVSVDAKQAARSVRLRCNLKELAIAGKPEARKRYNGLTSADLSKLNSAGFYNGNHAKGRKSSLSRMDLVEYYAAKYA